MPSRRNAVKVVRQDKKRKARNTYVKSTLKTARKDFEKLVESGSSDKVDAAYKTLVSLVDKTAKKGVIPTGRADRIKARYAAKTNSLLAKKS